MKLDLLYEIEAPKPWPAPHPYGQRAVEQKAYREALEQIRHADTLGFNGVWCVEHHFREGRSHMPSNEVVLGALTQVTKNLKLGFGVSLTPHEFIHPARVAEKVATVDVLSGGRVEWGIGRSTPMEQKAFGVDPERSRKQALAAAHTISEMWVQETYEEHSEYLVFPERMLTPRPFQDPHPPCWMAAVSPTSATVAGESGLGMLAMAILNPVEKLAESVKAYRAAAARAKPITRVKNDRAAAYTLVCCVETEEDLERLGVWDAVDWWFTSSRDFNLRWEHPNLTEEEKRKLLPYYEQQTTGAFNARQLVSEDMIIVGTPEQCLKKLSRYQDIGIDQTLCYVKFGPLAHEVVLRSLTLLGEQVIPALNRRATAKPKLEQV